MEEVTIEKRGRGDMAECGGSKWREQKQDEGTVGGKGESGHIYVTWDSSKTGN